MKELCSNIYSRKWNEQFSMSSASAHKILTKISVNQVGPIIFELIESFFRLYEEGHFEFLVLIVNLSEIEIHFLVSCSFFYFLETILYSFFD